MKNRYKNITTPLTIVAVVILILSIFSRSVWFRRRVSDENCMNRRMSNRYGAVEEKAEVYGHNVEYYMEDSMYDWDSEVTEYYENISSRLEENQERMEEKIERAGKRLERKTERLDDRFEEIFD